MSLATILLGQLSVATQKIETGSDVVPAWRIATPEGTFLILSKFDPEKPGERERAMHLVSRFMVWKMATSFVLTAVTWLGAPQGVRDEALLAVGVSHHERLAVLQRIRRGEAVGFSDPTWLAPHHIDGDYFRMLPGGRTEVSAEEALELARIFGKNGELPAQRLG
jgi:hypothetical protein